MRLDRLIIFEVRADNNKTVNWSFSISHFYLFKFYTINLDSWGNWQMSGLWLETILVGNITHAVSLTIWTSVLILTGDFKSFIISSNVVYMARFWAGLSIAGFNAVNSRGWNRLIITWFLNHNHNSNTLRTLSNEQLRLLRNSPVGVLMVSFVDIVVFEYLDLIVGNNTGASDSDEGGENDSDFHFENCVCVRLASTTKECEMINSAGIWPAFIPISKRSDDAIWRQKSWNIFVVAPVRAVRGSRS